MVHPVLAQIRPDPAIFEGRSRPPGLIPFIVDPGYPRPGPHFLFVVRRQADGSDLSVLWGVDSPPDALSQARWQINPGQLDTDDLPENPAKLLALMAREARGDVVLEMPTVLRGELAVKVGVETPKDLVAVNHGRGHAPSSHPITAFRELFFLDEDET